MTIFFRGLADVAIRRSRSADDARCSRRCSTRTTRPPTSARDAARPDRRLAARATVDARRARAASPDASARARMNAVNPQVRAAQLPGAAGDRRGRGRATPRWCTSCSTCCAAPTTSSPGARRSRAGAPSGPARVPAARCSPAARSAPELEHPSTVVHALPLCRGVSVHGQSTQWIGRRRRLRGHRAARGGGARQGGGRHLDLARTAVRAVDQLLPDRAGGGRADHALRRVHGHGASRGRTSSCRSVERVFRVPIKRQLKEEFGFRSRSAPACRPSTKSPASRAISSRAC